MHSHLPSYSLCHEHYTWSMPLLVQYTCRHNILYISQTSYPPSVSKFHHVYSAPCPKSIQPSANTVTNAYVIHSPITAPPWGLVSQLSRICTQHTRHRRFLVHAPPTGRMLTIQWGTLSTQCYSAWF